MDTDAMLSEPGDLGAEVAPSDRWPLSVGVLHPPPSASGTNISLLDRGLTDTWVGEESLHQAQGTFLRDAVVTETGREAGFRNQG